MMVGGQTVQPLLIGRPRGADGFDSCRKILSAIGIDFRTFRTVGRRLDLDWTWIKPGLDPIFGHLGEESPDHAFLGPRFSTHPIQFSFGIQRLNVSDTALPAALAEFAGRRPTPEPAVEQRVEPVG